MELSEAKEFLRVDFDDDDGVINSLITSSDQYLQGAGCNEKVNPELYQQAQKLLISNWYENRVPITVGPNYHLIDFSLQSIILQLKATGTSDDA